MVRPTRHDDCEVAVVGAGPYGLAAAAHLNAAGVAIRAFGEPMSFWRRHMPAGMRLRSPWRATSIADPGKTLSLAAYAAGGALAPQEQLPLESFIAYGEWFQAQSVPDLDQRLVARVETAGGGYRLVLQDGELVRTTRVVVATGLAKQAFRPAAFADLPAGLATHASEHDGFAAFRGRRVAVIGRGQSACESAVLLHEAGADVELVCRGDVNWLGGAALPAGWRRGLAREIGRIAAAPSAVGAFPFSWLAELPGLVHRLSPDQHDRFNARCLRAGAAGWLLPRSAGVRINSGRIIRAATASGDRVALVLDNGTSVFDHILLATGYQTDIDKLGLLAPELAGSVLRRAGSPVLSAGLESSLPGLHFAGASAVASFGPLLRFIAGTSFAARSLTRAVLRDRAARSPRRTRFRGDLAAASQTARRS